MVGMIVAGEAAVKLIVSRPHDVKSRVLRRSHALQFQRSFASTDPNP
jgi:hypothetical protein